MTGQPSESNDTAPINNSYSPPTTDWKYKMSFPSEVRVFNADFLPQRSHFDDHNDWANKDGYFGTDMSEVMLKSEDTDQGYNQGDRMTYGEKDGDDININVELGKVKVYLYLKKCYSTEDAKIHVQIFDTDGNQKDQNFYTVDNINYDEKMVCERTSTTSFEMGYVDIRIKDWDTGSEHRPVKFGEKTTSGSNPITYHMKIEYMKSGGWETRYVDLENFLIRGIDSHYSAESSAEHVSDLDHAMLCHADDVDDKVAGKKQINLDAGRYNLKGELFLGNQDSDINFKIEVKKDSDGSVIYSENRQITYDSDDYGWGYWRLSTLVDGDPIILPTSAKYRFVVTLTDDGDDFGIADLYLKWRADN